MITRRIAAALRRMPGLARIAGLFAGEGNDRGAAAVEFAFIAPAFTFTIYGVIEFFRAAFTMAILFFAAEEATRYATVHYGATPTAIQQVAQDNLLLLQPSQISKFEVTSVLDAVDQTKHVTVVIEYAFSPMLPLPWNTITLSGQSRGFIVEK